MPTERFRRLSEEKQRCIREAAIQEFIRVPFDKASINKIIQSANISRGSFYTYFTDKKDLLLTIFDQQRIEMTNFCHQKLQERHGDFFGMLEDFFEKCLEWFQDGSVFQLVKNVMLYQDNHDLFGFNQKSRGERCGPFTVENDWMYDNLDLDLLRYKSREEVQVLMNTAIAVTAMSMSRFYQSPEKTDEIRRQFRFQMDILRYGAMVQADKNDEQRPEHRQG